MNKISLNKQEALELIIDDKTIIIDCRTPEELEDVPPISDDVYNIPFGNDFMETIAEEADEFPKEATILVYCAHGVRSLRAVRSLREAGYLNAYDLEGGISAIFESEGC